MEAIPGGAGLAELRNSIRSATIGRKVDTWLHKTVDINGSKVDIKRPSQKERSAIRKRATLKADGSMSLDFALMAAHAIIALTYVPDSGFEQPVFTMTDLESLLAQPAGEWFDELTEHVMESLNVKRDDIEKKSETTTTIATASG